MGRAGLHKLYYWLLSNYFNFQSISSAQIYQIRRLIEPELAFSVVSHLKKRILKRWKRRSPCRRSPLRAAHRTGIIIAKRRLISTIS